MEDAITSRRRDPLVLAFVDAMSGQGGVKYGAERRDKAAKDLCALRANNEVDMNNVTFALVEANYSPYRWSSGFST